MHQHKCGYVGPFRLDDEPEESQGCGYIFEHDDSALNDKALHMCPVCGAGPWWTAYDEELCEFIDTVSELLGHLKP